MCKLFALSNTTGLTSKQLDTLLVRLNRRFLETEGDGFGWALGPNTPRPQPHVIERFVAPASFGGLSGGIRVYDQADANVREAIDPPDADYREVFSSPPTGPLIVHGRKASGTIALENTHPFHKSGWTLAHNGYVEADDPLEYETESTCDSEHLLNSCVFGKGPSEFAEKMTGRYAILALDPNNVLHVAKNRHTELWMAQAPSGWAFATDPRDLFSAFKMLNFLRPVPVPVRSDRHIQVKDGRIVSVVPIEPMLPIYTAPYTRYQKQGEAGWRHEAATGAVAN